MKERNGSAETRELLKALLVQYPCKKALADKCHYSQSYVSFLSLGERVASKAFCRWVKTAHPELKDLCAAVQLSKVMY